MILRTQIKATVNPDALSVPVRRAEHAVAVQAERDSRRYIPEASGKLRSSGKVRENVITWDTPYARLLYFGYVYVDPKYGKAGFNYPNLGIMRSRKGVKKVKTGRKYNINRGNDQWFARAKKANLDKWLILAKEEIERGG